MGAHWLDDPSDPSCKNSTRQHTVDGPRLSCNLLPYRSARGSAERLGLREGSAVTVVIKSIDVLLATIRPDDYRSRPGSPA